MSNASAKKRVKLFNKQRGKCWLCREPMILYPDDPDDPRRCSLDHVVPKAAGGSNNIANLKAAHRSCNMERGFADFRLTKKQGLEL